jgi:hypothetical protein
MRGIGVRKDFWEHDYWFHGRVEQLDPIKVRVDGWDFATTFDQIEHWSSVSSCSYSAGDQVRVIIPFRHWGDTFAKGSILDVDKVVGVDGIGVMNEDGKRYVIQSDNMTKLEKIEIGEEIMGENDNFGHSDSQSEDTTAVAADQSTISISLDHFEEIQMPDNCENVSVDESIEEVTKYSDPPKTNYKSNESI